MRRGTRVVCGWIAGCLSTTVIAHARDDANPLRLSFERCAGVEAEQVVPLLTLELRTTVELVGAAAKADLSCACDERGGEVVLLSVAGGETRHLALGAIDGSLRARVVSLALADMLEQSRSGPATTVEAPTPAEVAPPALEPALPRAKRPRALVGAQVGGRVLPETRALSLATALSVRLPITRQVGLNGELGASVGRDRAYLGRIDERSLEFALRAEGILTSNRTCMLLLGAGPRAARARLVGHPDRSAELMSRSFDGWWAGPEAELALATRLGSRGVFTLRAHGGWRTLAMQPEVDGNRIRAWSGPWLGVAFGVARSFGVDGAGALQGW